MNRSDRRRQEALQGKTGSADSFAVHNLLDQGKRHHQAGQLAEAEHNYQLALNMAPGHPEALHLLGLLAYRVGSYEQAIELITHAIQGTPNSPLYWFNLGVVTQKAGKAEEAIRAYERAIALNAKYVDALINLGNVLKDLHRLADAVQTYRKALTLNPAHADTHNNLGVALKEQNALREALADVKMGMCADCQRRADTNPMRVLDCKVEADQDIIAALPIITENLDEPCREHFSQFQRQLRLRGIEAAAPSGFAEGLFARKLVM